MTDEQSSGPGPGGGEGQGAGGTARKSRGRRGRRRGGKGREGAARPAEAQEAGGGAERAPAAPTREPGTDGRTAPGEQGAAPSRRKGRSRGRGRGRGKGPKDEARKDEGRGAVPAGGERGAGGAPEERPSGSPPPSRRQDPTSRPTGPQEPKRSRSRRKRREAPASAPAAAGPSEDRESLDAGWRPPERDTGPEYLVPREVAPYYLLPRSYDPDGLATDEPDYGWPAGEQLHELVTVRFSRGDRVEEFDSGDERYEKGDRVVLETDKGLQLGVVTTGTRRAMCSSRQRPRVVRRMNEADRRQEARNAEKERMAFALCASLVREHRLPMKLVSADCLHGGNRTTLYFSSEGRVDFRNLVRELTSKLHSRVEMRQVGVRDESRLVGGLGPCGLQLCCNAFLSRFAPVSIRMAKDQNLVLNPQKVSGVCGRLMCCLTYEQKAYESARKGLPKVGRRVVLPDGSQGRVRDVDVLARKVRVQTEDGTSVVVAPEELTVPTPEQAAADQAGRRSGRT